MLLIALVVAHERTAPGQVVVADQPQITEPLIDADEPTEATGLFEPIPRGGVIEELTQDLGLGVWTARLGNGVLVHVMTTEARADWVEITIVLGGGLIDESSAARGLTHAAVQVFERPATRSLDAQTIARRLSGRVLEVSGRARLEGVTVVLSGDRSEMVAAMQLARVLLTAPRIEASALGQWRAIQSENARSYQSGVSAQLNTLAIDAIYPRGEMRVRPLSAERIETISLVGAQAWLDRLVATAPVEVGIVGDLSTAEALELARVYLGSIGSRRRVGRVDRPLVEPEPLPAVARTLAAGHEREALVLVGYLIPDRLMREHERVLRVAARVISERLETPGKGEASLGGSCRLVPGLGLLDHGLLYVVLPADPDGIDSARRAAREQLAALAGRDAQIEEIQRARSGIIDEVIEAGDDPAWWSRRLGWWRSSGRPLEPTARVVGAYEAVTAGQVRDAVRRVLHPQRLIDLSVGTDPESSRTDR